jgi:phosphomannomutase
LWERAPLAARKDGSKRGGRASRPTVIVGHDERPSSPDVVTGVVAGLRRTGCQVVDISLATRACFAFAVDHVQAQAGIFVTGNGCDPSWTGMDFVGPGGCPISRAGQAASHGMELSLDLIEERLKMPFYRPARHAGTHRSFQALVPYEASLWKHFHALRPLKVVCGCPSRLVRKTLERVFATLPCRLQLVDVPQRSRNLADPEDVDVTRVGRAVNEQDADVGVLIDDDGCGVAFVDELGRLAAATEITVLLAGHVLVDHAGAAMVLDRTGLAILRTKLELRGATAVDGEESLATMYAAMHASEAVFGGGERNIYWFRESVPTCDAFLSIAKLLQALSRSDTPFSEVIRASQGWAAE